MSSEPIDEVAARRGRRHGSVGERAALTRWWEFICTDLVDYAELRDRPDLDGTSRLSVFLKHGEIHPRTLLADLATLSPDAPGLEAFVTELAWREFHRDVLWHRPDSAWTDLTPALSAMPFDRGGATDELVEAWHEGRTGFPFVDAIEFETIMTTPATQAA